MGIRIKADHLTCPTCGAAITALNRLNPEARNLRRLQTRDRLHAVDPGSVCESCVDSVFGQVPEPGLISKLRTRFTGMAIKI